MCCRRDDVLGKAARTMHADDLEVHAGGRLAHATGIAATASKEGLDHYGRARIAPWHLDADFVHDAGDLMAADYRVARIRVFPQIDVHVAGADAGRAHGDHDVARPGPRYVAAVDTHYP